MSTENLAKGAVEVMERYEKKKQNESAQEIILDDSNKVSFPGYPYTFEALNEKILVSIDIFKSGYECKNCKGKKRIKSHCECENHDRPGYRYSSEQIKALETDLGPSIAETRSRMFCTECDGNYINRRIDIECPDCEGRGALLVLPETSKNLPTTGVVVSMGEKAKKLADFKIGDRILFGAYAGTMIPTKIGLMFKYMDWQLGVVKIEGAEDMSAFDFILQAEE